VKNVKLVIWDLDDTFWSGTLSEGPISYSKAHHDIVIELTHRGIINSIASKNNFDDVKACLEKEGIWDYFVFPKIAWQPKGQLIRTMIEEMQLRSENVLLIDDNHLNREEAKYCNPELQTAVPDILEKILSLESCKGKDDHTLSRLKHYKILERKVTAQNTTQCTNEEFLRTSTTEVNINFNCAPELDRILELINRTNQLNYTKLRMEKDKVVELINNNSMEKAFVRVRDKYGDYGICGFYALHDSRLVHFVFSCRILNMGIENWLYHKLGYPGLEIVGETATPLRQDTVPDWIHETSFADTVTQKSPERYHGVHIIIKGGCDLQQIKNYLIQGDRFDAEVDYVSHGGFRINNSHTEILKRCSQHTIQKYGDIIDRIHFFDRDAFRSHFFTDTYHVRIYSVLDDYTRGLYRYRDTDFIIPFGDFSQDLSDETCWSYHLNRSAKHKLDRDFLGWFKDNFTFLGGLDEKSFKQNINWMCTNVSLDKLLIILNGSEVEYYPHPQNERWKHHAKMNAALDETIHTMQHVMLCDVREFVQSVSDHSHNIRHYSRRVYFLMAKKLNELIGKRYPISHDFPEKRFSFIKYYLAMKGRYTWKRLVTRLLPGMN